MWHRTIPVAALALLTLAGARGVAADEKRPSPDQIFRFRDIKAGTKRFVQENTPKETQDNQAAIKSVADWHVAERRLQRG
jgi:hypothetical protein